MNTHRYAFEYDTPYTLDDIQALDPTCSVDEHDELGPAIYADVGNIEYVFRPEGDLWQLDHVWTTFSLHALEPDQ